MDQDNSRLPEIIDYLKANPMKTVEEGGTHYHIHLPPPPPPAPLPPPTVAQKVIPWLYVVLAACIIGTICAAILAVVMIALLIGLLGFALGAAVLAHLIKTTRESKINLDLARERRPDRRN